MYLFAGLRTFAKIYHNEIQDLCSLEKELLY